MSSNAKSRPLAFVIHDLNPYGGQDRSTLEIARRLSHRWPVEVHAFTLEDPRMDDWGKVELHLVRPGIKRPVLAKSSFFYGAILPDLWLKPRLSGGARPVIHATGACSLVSDVVQVQFVNEAWKRLVRKERQAGAPPSRIRRAYSNLLLEYDSAIERKIYTPDKTYIAISKTVARELEDCFGLRESVHVIHHGVDPGFFKPATTAGEKEARERLRSACGVGRGELACLFVGSYERKGLDTALEAMAILPSVARAKVKLVAVGGGDTEAFAKRAQELGVADRVRLVGPTREIHRYYQAADLFFLPTRYEPFGLVILEAMAAGLAPVVSRLAGASELLEHGKSGLLLDDPRDPREAADQIARIASDPALRESLGARSREIAEGRSWDRVAEEYAAVLAPLMG